MKPIAPIIIIISFVLSFLGGIFVRKACTQQPTSGDTINIVVVNMNTRDTISKASFSAHTELSWVNCGEYRVILRRK